MDAALSFLVPFIDQFLVLLDHLVNGFHCFVQLDNQLSVLHLSHLSGFGGVALGLLAASQLPFQVVNHSILVFYLVS